MKGKGYTFTPRAFGPISIRSGDIFEINPTEYEMMFT
jgi:hypothetical protein